jgi:hypothetical protein
MKMTSTKMTDRHRMAPATNQHESEARIKRLILVGALATFVSFFGLSLASSAVVDTTSASSPEVRVVQASNGQQIVVRRHVRSRTS